MTDGIADRAGMIRSQVKIGRSLARFLAVGVASAAVDIGLLYVMRTGLGLWLPAATLIAVVAAFLFNFVLNRIWSFGSAGPVGAQLARYLTLAGGNWICTVAGVAGLAALGAHYLASKVLVLAVATALNFVAYRAWVFR